jgi:hypothetical protein
MVAIFEPPHPKDHRDISNTVDIAFGLRVVGTANGIVSSWSAF